MQNRLLYFFTLLTGLFLLINPKSQAQEETDQKQAKVLVMEIRDVIDPRMNRQVELALNRADEIEADYVIIDMDTYGGAVNDADDIRTRILEYPKPVWVFINKDAASAGALISIACDSIYMAPGASIGAATVVTQTGEAAPDKYQSYMRSIMRSTAEANGRDPKIAEAMVDETIDLDTIAPAGQVLTLSTSEAIELNFCEGEVNSIEEILERNGVEDYTVDYFHLGAIDKVIAFFLNPFISGILILVIIGGIYFELQTPGVGFPILASAIALVLYLVPYYLNGLAENWEILLFVVGVVLLALEMFVIPGFGVAGISGIILMLGSLVLMMLNNDAFDFSFVRLEAIIHAVLATVGGLLGSIMLLFFGGMKLTDSHAFQRISLQTTQMRSEGYTSNFKTESFVGRKGSAFTILRPSGKVLIDGHVFDAYARGGYIEKGAEIIVVSDEGTSLKVKKSIE
jgi:membrane-bound serine protease (ClpP class)